MEQLHLADHLLAAGLALLSAALASGKLGEGSVEDRLTFYTSAIVSSIALSAMVLSVWAVEGRPLEGFGLYGWFGEWPVTLALGVGWLALVLLYVLLVSRGFLQKQLRPVYTRLAVLMPSNRREVVASWFTSACAGSGEEIIYRGFLLWYAAAILGEPAALVVVSVLFGLAHGYQSRWGMIFASIAGVVLGGIYVASGSLLLVMWAHATYNMASFFIGGRIILRGGDGGHLNESAGEQLTA